MKKSDEARQASASKASLRQNLARKRREQNALKRLEKKELEIKAMRQKFQRFKAKNMYGKNGYSGTEQTVVKSFEPSTDPDIINLVSQDFDSPLPDLLTLHEGDLVTVYKKGLGLVTHKWTSGEIFGHRGIFPTSILDASEIHNQMHLRAEQYREKKEILRSEKEEQLSTEEAEYMKECTFAPKLRRSNVYISARVVENFTRYDLDIFNNEFSNEKYAPLVVVAGQEVKILKKGLGKGKNWYLVQLSDGPNRKGYLPYHCIDPHEHVHSMHARDHESAININRLRLAEKDSDLKDCTFKPKINKYGQKMYLPKNYKRVRRMREERRRLRQLKDANKELTFQPNIYRPTRSKIDTNNSLEVTEAVDTHIQLFANPMPKAPEPLHIKKRLERRQHLGISKAHVKKSFKFARPGAATEVLIADFGLKHPVPLELYVGDKVSVLQRGVGKNGKWTLGHLGNTTGVFPTSCIEEMERRSSKDVKREIKGREFSHSKIQSKEPTKRSLRSVFVKQSVNKRHSLVRREQKNLSVSFDESILKSEIPKNHAKARDNNALNKKSPKRKFLKKSVRSVLPSEKWSFGTSSSGAPRKSIPPYVENPVMPTVNESKAIQLLRRKLKRKLEKIPKLQTNVGTRLYREDFTKWLVTNDLIENENRRVVDLLFNSIAVQGHNNINFRDVARSLHDVKLKRTTGNRHRKASWSW